MSSNGITYKRPGPEELSIYTIGCIYSLEPGATRKDDVLVLCKYKSPEELDFGRLVGVAEYVDPSTYVTTGTRSRVREFYIIELSTKARRQWTPD